VFISLKIPAQKIMGSLLVSISNEKEFKMKKLFASLLSAALLISLFAAPPPALSETGTEEIQFADHFVVEYAGAVDNLQSAVAAMGGSLDRVHQNIRLARVSGLSDDQAAELARVPGVRSVTRDVILQWIPDVEPVSTTSLADAVPQGHDPTDAFFFDIQWNMHIINADDAWDAGYFSNPGIRVAIIDTGIDPFHQDIAGLVDEGSSIAFTPSLNPLGPDWGDDHWHGTHVGGTVVTNGIGTSGVAPHTTLIAVKVLDVTGSGSFEDVIAGIVHSADVNANVINMSLGAIFPKNVPGGGQLVAALNKAVNYAQSRGSLVVSAAGNAALDLDRSGNLTAVPCESGAGMCISSTGPTDELASYSNYGHSAINIAAPGGDFIVTGNPETSTVLAPCSTLSLVIPICQLGGFYVFAQGTSMAAPHVAGAAALLDAQHDGDLNPGQLRTRLQQSADDLGKPGADPFYGHGRLNVFEAVTR
jgi:lantibiotic leader peptide-processing serine protease